MAAAVRLTDPYPPSPTVTLIGTGDFGHRVVEILQPMLPGAEVAGPDALETVFAEGEGPVVLALWRSSPALCESADVLAHRYVRPWLPIVMEHPVLRIGPLIDPPSGPCFRCYRDRRAQHDPGQVATASVDDAYDRDPDLGPGGYLVHHARFAASLAVTMLHSLATGAGPSAEVVTASLLSAQVSVNRVISWNGCDRERSVRRTPPRPFPPSGSTAEPGVGELKGLALR